MVIFLHRFGLGIGVVFMILLLAMPLVLASGRISERCLVDLPFSCAEIDKDVHGPSIYLTSLQDVNNVTIHYNTTIHPNMSGTVFIDSMREGEPIRVELSFNKSICEDTPKKVELDIEYSVGTKKNHTFGYLFIRSGCKTKYHDVLSGIMVSLKRYWLERTFLSIMI